MSIDAHRPCELFYPIICVIKVTDRNRAWEYDPEEIEKKLKELEITQEEAVNRASAFNINLEEYLSKMRSIKPEK